MENRFIPYPFQNNVGGLSPETALECLTGAVEAATNAAVANATCTERRPANFAEWIQATMGAGHREALHGPVQLQGLGDAARSS